MSNQVKTVIFTTVSLIMVFLIGGYAYKNYKSNEVVNMARSDKSLFQRDYSYTIGPKDAKVHIVEFFDPACGTCAAFHPFVKDIMKKNPGKIKLTYRYAPFHKGSDYVVKMLEAAKNQGKFIEMLEVLFANQNAWISNHTANTKEIWKFLPNIGLDIDKFVQDLKDPKLNDIIATDLSDAKKLGVRKTPSYFVNYKPLQTFGYEPLQELIDSEL